MRTLHEAPGAVFREAMVRAFCVGCAHVYDNVPKSQCIVVKGELCFGCDTCLQRADDLASRIHGKGVDS